MPSEEESRPSTSLQADGPPLFSFIVLSFNYERYIGKTIDSILAQTIQDFEIVVVDDGSRDGSVDLIRSYDDPRIRLIVNEKNLGGTRSYNRAVEAARGVFLVNLDSDDWIAPDKLERQLAMFEADPQLDIVGSYIKVVDQDGLPHERAGEIELHCNRPLDLNQVASWVVQNPLCRSSTIFRREAHMRIGLDDPDMLYTCDWELWIRALRLGCKFAVLPEQLCFYRWHGKNITHRDPASQYIEACFLLARNMLPLIDRTSDLTLFAEVLNWAVIHDQFAKIPARTRYRIFASLVLPPETASYAEFRAIIMGETPRPDLETLGKRALSLFRNHPAKIFELAHFQLQGKYVELAAEYNRVSQIAASNGAGSAGATDPALIGGLLRAKEAAFRSRVELSDALARARAALVQRSLEPARPTITDTVLGWVRGKPVHPAVRAGLFDAAWYLAHNLDVLESGMDPLEHYVSFGAREGRAPGPLFNPDWYLRQNPDVGSAGMDALQHYLAFGKAEGRAGFAPHPDREALAASGLFDAVWYRATYPDIAMGGLDPLDHYLDHGLREGRSPSPNFDASWYLATYPDVAMAGLDPALHYIRFGASEGRQRRQADGILDSQPAQLSRPPVRLLSSGMDEPAPVLENAGDAPLVSVIIPCFEYGHFVEEAVRSVVNQTLQDVEIIVVEGGSPSRESRDRVAALAFPRTKILFQKSPHLVCANRNFGIRHARGKYICCLDADDTLEPTYLEMAVFMLEGAGYDVVSSGQRTFGERDEVIGPLPRPTLNELRFNNQVLVCAVYRRSLWEKAGGYRDPDTSAGPMIHQDWLFWMKLAAQGATFFNLSRAPLLRYRAHSGSMTGDSRMAPDDMQASLIAEALREHMTFSALDRSALASAERSSAAFRPEEVASLDVGSAQRTILVALPWAVLGGVERLLSAVTRHLSARAWRIIVITTQSPEARMGDTSSWFDSATREIYHLPLLLEPERWMDFLRYLFASRQIAIALCAGSRVFYDAMEELSRLSPRTVFVDELFNTAGHFASNRQHASKIGHIIVENTEVLAALKAAGESAERITLIPNGVDTQALAPREDRETLRASLDLPAGKVVVIYAGRLSPEKSPLAFVQIAERFKTRRDILFLMIGAGPLEEEIRTAIELAGLPPSLFRFAGAGSDPYAMIGASDLLVLPSKLDGRPTAVMEAMSMGVPVIASRVGGLPELVADGEDGLLVDPGDVSGFASAVERLSADANERRRLGDAARRSACAGMDQGRMLKAYEDLFIKLAGA